MPWNVARDCHEDVDEKVLADSKTDENGERGNEEAEDDDDEGGAMVTTWCPINLAVLLARDSVSQKLGHGGVAGRESDGWVSHACRSTER